MEKTNKSREITRDIFQYYNHLGSYCPYYFVSEGGERVIESNFSALIARFHIAPEIDQISIAEVLNKRHMLGDRTIIKGIFRVPWMAKPDSKSLKWEFYKIPLHQEKIENVKYIAETLFKLICKEIKAYICSAKNIGILLSGGMDSRMVAGALDYLIKTKQIDVANVTAYTWGNHDSRDVVYAEEISRRLNWKWKHYVVSSSDLWENFIVAGYRGCEYSGLHLHAIPQIQQDIKDDILLVGSYGDSIGRAEYSGVHVENLIPVKKGFKNYRNLLKHNAYKRIRNLWNSDIDSYHVRFYENKPYQQVDLDYQLHYMRRMLNPCLEILNDIVPTHQVFTSPEIYQYMWSLKPDCRNDMIYLHMMDLFQTSLNDIPWARTGLPYGVSEGQPDNFKKHHDSYMHFIQNELIDNIAASIQTERIKSLGFLNSKTIKVLIRMVRKYPEYNSDYLERITWLVSLDCFLEKYVNLKSEKSESDYLDYFAAQVITPIQYLLLQIYRRIRY